MFDRLPTDEVRSEAAESQAAESRALDDATLEPRSVVERTGSFAEAESVQSEFEKVTENGIRSADQGAPSDGSGWIGEPGDTGPNGAEADEQAYLGHADVAAAQVHEGTAAGAATQGERPIADQAASEAVDRHDAAPFSEGPERLDGGQMPEAAANLTGIGNQGGTNASKGFGPEAPINMPETDALITGAGGLGSGPAPKVYGNVPGHMGQHGSGGMPGSGFLDGMMDMPTGGGFHSSGGGLPMNGPGGGVGEGTDDGALLGQLLGGAMGAGMAGGAAGAGAGAGAAGAGGAAGGSKAGSGVSEKDMDWAHSYTGSTYQSDSSTCYTLAKLVLKKQQRKEEVESMGGPEAPGYSVMECRYKASGDREAYIFFKGETGGTQHVYRKMQDLEGTQPTPYTGRFITGLGTPERDDDTSRVLVNVAPNGKGGDVWRSDPDSTDDSGKFYGGIMSGYVKTYPDSGGARPIDPKRATAAADTADEAESAATKSRRRTG